AVYGAAVLLLVSAFLWYGNFFNPSRYAKGVAHVCRIIFAEGFPPDFTRYREWGKALLDTLAMSVGGTALAVVLSLGIAWVAARNTTPHPVVYLGARRVLNLLRALPGLIRGLILVVAVQGGVWPGIWALGLHSVGMVGKFFAEAIEHADPGPVEAVAATGATRIQVLCPGVLPQVWPRMADVAFY